MMRIAVLLACHNRRDTTLACLGALRRQRHAPGSVDLTVYVLDDGSSDGTAAAVQHRHPEAIVLRGDGSLYWNGGMRTLLNHAAAGDFDAYLWLNDDTLLDDDAVSRLLAVYRRLQERGFDSPLVVGPTREPDTGEVTYGGRYRPSSLRRLHFAVVPASDAPRPVETMNGNVVFLPSAAAAKIGNLDPSFRHAFGDEDYGLRAWQAGSSVWVVPGTVGTCRRDRPPAYGTKPLRTELTQLTHVTSGLDPRSWWEFARRHGGVLWPLYWASPYVRRATRICAAHLR